MSSLTRRSWFCADAVLPGQPGRHGQGLHALQPLQEHLPGGGGRGGGERCLPALAAGAEGDGGAGEGGALEENISEGGEARRLGRRRGGERRCVIVFTVTLVSHYLFQQIKP